MPQNSVLKETKILALICLIDLVITSWIYLITGGDPGVERNPLMRYFMMTGGLPAFLAAKIAFSFPGLVMVEWYRTKRPVFTLWLARFVIVAYLIIFIGGSALSFI